MEDSICNTAAGWSVVTEQRSQNLWLEDDQTKSNRIYFLFYLFPTVSGKCQIKRVSSPKNSEEIETDDF